MSEKDTTASSMPPDSGDAQVEATEEALESRGQLGRDYLWNTAASLMSSLAVVIMGVAIMRSGATDSFARAQYGLFTLALAIGQQYQTVGLYEVRTFHVTDVRRRFDFGTYLSTRLLTCLVMVGLIAYHSWTASTKDPYPAFTVIAAMALLRIFDAFEDVYYSEFQRSGRLDIAGKACFARIFTTTFLWSGLYWFTQDLLTSTLITFVVTCVVLVVAYGLPARGVFPLLPSFNLRGIAGILWECLPLFIAAFLNQYLANAPRFAIHASLGDEELGVFAIIYMPAVAINMLSLFVFRPLLTRMALRWAEGKREEFLSIVRKGLLTTAAAFVVVAAVEAENADFYIVNTRFHLTSLLGARLAHRLGRPVALIEHGTAHMSVGNPVLDFFGGIYEHGLTHFVKKHVTSYYGVSRNCNKWLRHFGIEASGVWYNAVTPEDTAVADDRYEREWPRGGSDSEIVISYAGRLIAEKGIVALLEAFARLRAELPDVPLRLAVAGSGPIEEELHERYGSDPAVSFLGKLDFPAVMSLYRRSDVFVYPSMYPEGLPTSILEAALGDCAIVATPRGGTEEVITSPALGWIVDGRTSAELTDALVPALREAVTDPVRRASCAAAVGARVREHFTWQSVAREVASVIDEAVAR